MCRNILNVLCVIGAPLFESTLAPRRSIAFRNSAGTWSRAPGKQFGVLDRWRDRHTRPARWSDTLRIRPVRWRKWNRIRIDLARLADPIGLLPGLQTSDFHGDCYPSQHWLKHVKFSELLGYSSEGNFTRHVQDLNHWNMLQKCTVKITAISPWVQWVNSLAPEGCGSNFKTIIFKLIIQNSSLLYALAV